MKTRKLHRSGFTLIELLIVTVVIASLMAIVFRLAGIAGGTKSVQRTVARMQRLENCLSGYYAAFGSYPPVPLQGTSRDVYRKAMNNGVQGTDSDVSEGLEWQNVEAACRAQPVRAEFPTPEGYHGYLENFQSQVRELSSQDFFNKSTKDSIGSWVNDDLRNLNSSGDGGADKKATSFNEVQFFRYGVMSFLLPRYLFMLDCCRDVMKDYKYVDGFVFWEYAQWTEFNPLPARMNTGTQYEGWKGFCQSLFGKDEWEIELIPSQAACARWMSNLVATPDDPEMVRGKKIEAFGFTVGDGRVLPSPQNPEGFKAYGSNGYSDSGPSGGMHSLFYITMQDGWGVDFFYYSPPPYQTYVVWSSGPDGKTMPPWVDLKGLPLKDYNTALEWIADDIKGSGKGK